MEKEAIINIIKDLYEEILSNRQGENAHYIKQLRDANPEPFAISVRFVDGTSFDIGDHNDEFTIQSCGKVVNYCLVRSLDKDNIVHEYVGYEPSGQKFNAFFLKKEDGSIKRKIPHNPLINAGAMSVISMLEPDLYLDERFVVMKNFYQNFIGGTGKIYMSQEINKSEHRTASRNRALGHYMISENAFPPHVTEENLEKHLELYFNSCSILINTKMGANIAAILANGGTCPITAKEVVSRSITRDILSIMDTCGMYDYSGQFTFKVGCPAKSGVSGCILLVIPGHMGICIWSRRLDSKGNSVRGIEFCQKFTERTNYCYHKFYRNALVETHIVETPASLIGAASKGDLEKVKILVNKMGPNVKDYDSRTALHLATAETHTNVVECLLEMKAHPNLHDRDGNTPLHIANLCLKKANETNNEDMMKSCQQIVDLITSAMDNIESSAE